MVHLHGPSDLIASRLRSRSGHFMGAEMLQSQLRDLELPSRATRLDIRLSVEELLQCMIKALAERRNLMQNGLCERIVKRSVNSSSAGYCASPCHPGRERRVLFRLEMTIESGLNLHPSHRIYLPIRRFGVEAVQAANDNAGVKKYLSRL